MFKKKVWDFVGLNAAQFVHGELIHNLCVWVCMCKSSACRAYRAAKDPISVTVPRGGKNPKCAPVGKTSLPDWCLTFLHKSPDSLQISSEMGRIKAASSAGEESFKAGLMYAAR